MNVDSEYERVNGGRERMRKKKRQSHRRLEDF